MLDPSFLQGKGYISIHSKFLIKKIYIYRYIYIYKAGILARGRSTKSSGSIEEYLLNGDRLSGISPIAGPNSVAAGLSRGK